MADNGFNWGGFLGGFGSLLGAGINSATQSKINQENLQMQKEFAQNGIQWKVQDAQKAGIHPAVALGAQTYQATPSSVAPDVGSGVSGAFKHFGSAIDSFIDDKEEERNLQLENMRLQNEKEKLEIDKMRGSLTSNLFGGLMPKAYVSQPFTSVYESAGGNKYITLNKDLMDYVQEKDLKDAAVNGAIVKELELHASNINQNANLRKDGIYYIPASIDEMALSGLPYLKPVSRPEWQQYVNERSERAKREAEQERWKRDQFKKRGDPYKSTNTTAWRPYRQPTDFDFSYRGKK